MAAVSRGQRERRLPALAPACCVCAAERGAVCESHECRINAAPLVAPRTPACQRHAAARSCSSRSTHQGSHRGARPVSLGAAEPALGSVSAAAGTVAVSSGGSCPQMATERPQRVPAGMGWTCRSEDAESPRACSAPPASARRAFLAPIKRCRSSAQAYVDAVQQSPARPRPSPAPLCFAPAWLGARALAVCPCPTRSATCPAARSFRQPVHSARLSSLASESPPGWKGGWGEVSAGMTRGKRTGDKQGGVKAPAHGLRESRRGLHVGHSAAPSETAHGLRKSVWSASGGGYLGTEGRWQASPVGAPQQAPTVLVP